MKITQTIEKEVTWADIKTMADNGKIKSGDSISFVLKNGEEVVVKATYDEKDKLFFVLDDCLNGTRAMNKNATNKGGWAKCEMRNYLNTTIFALLPDELQALIKPTKIVQVLKSERIECEDKLFLLSKTQVFGKNWDAGLEPEDTHFDIFKYEKDRIKEYHNSTWCWWLRSPYASSNTNFYLVYATGDDSNYSANNSSGVAFGFCI